MHLHNTFDITIVSIIGFMILCVVILIIIGLITDGIAAYIKCKHRKIYHNDHVFASCCCFSCSIYLLGLKHCQYTSMLHVKDIEENYPTTNIKYSIKPYYKDGKKYFTIHGKCGLLNVPTKNLYSTIEEAQNKIMDLKKLYVDSIKDRIDANKKDLSDNIKLYEINKELEKMYI